jgi:hypothetical protein
MPLNRAILMTRYQILPDRFSVTLTPKNPTANAIGPIQGVTSGNLTEAEIAQYAAGIETGTKVFTIPVLTLQQVTTQVPLRGWWLTDTAGDWTIKAVNYADAEAMIRCVCIKNV